MKNKIKIKPSADTEMSMWHSGYQKGFDDGKKNSLKHNINLMKLQLKAINKFGGNK